MNKWMKAASAALLALTLSACGSADTPKTEIAPAADTGAKSVKEKEDKQTAKDVFRKTMEVSESIKSLHGKMTIDQNMKVVDDDSMRMKNKMTIEMDVITEPLTLHQTLDMTSDTDESMNMEMYAKDGELYMQMDDMEGGWLSVPPEMQDEILTDMKSSNAMIELEVFQEFEDKFTLEEKDDQYVLHFKASGEEFSDLLKELMEQEAADVSEDGLSNIDVKKIDLTLYIDKDTYYTDSYDMQLDAIMDIGGYRTVALQTLNADISKIDEVEPFDIPQEVIDNAFSMDE
ncbi:hypothetical protein NCCP2716_08180 [Sporosarcina sp. NCCP-2716]|uniref:DUF6612 family protein n=1 Tax=Sporosarcina sp. NCCP-2716 TaxID=2943679 RepID=UPI00203C9861|nr:DUF6612 family protein [Sporosarcina sp. NCCP-2716]GKV68320.1 hypothetical protein NCCP2716_08180 [Sporosarcina sp. NCCP-2716]